MRHVTPILLLAACAAEPVPTGPEEPSAAPPPPTATVREPTLPLPVCELDLPEAGPAPVDPACAAGVPRVLDPWSGALEQRLVAVAPAHTPVVGHLDDDDGDGRVGPGDVPEIVAVDAFAGLAGSAMVVWSGGREKLTLPGGFHAGVAPLIADVDGDGAGEIVVGVGSDELPSVAAIDARGEEVWRTGPLDLQGLGDGAPCSTTAADLDGDGALEVVVGGHVLDGRTGATRAVLALDTTWPGAQRGVIAADLDQDGSAEVVVGDAAFDATGAVLWTFPEKAALSAMPALAQLDRDPEAEIVVSRWDELVLLDHDGRPRRRVPLQGASGTAG